MAVKVAVVGATGTMGQLVVRLVKEADDLELYAALGRNNELDEMVGADVVVDVTHPASSGAIVEYAVDNALPIVVGTSGWSAGRIRSLEARRDALEDTAAVVFVPNFSLGSALGTKFAQQAARWFDSIEIVEAHHAGKVDSPSGTAVRTAELIGAARSDLGPARSPHTDQRARGDLISGIPVHSMRLSGLLAKQEVTFGGIGETLTISHFTTSAASYEAGILLAIRQAPLRDALSIGLDALLE